MPTRQDRPPSSWQRPPAPGERPPAPAADDDAQVDALRWVRRFGLLMLSGILIGTLSLPWPWPLLSGVVSLTAVGIGVVALVKVRSARVRRGMTVVLVVGMALAAVLGVSSLFRVMLWSENATYSQCVRSALTEQARDACRAEMENTIDQRVRWMEQLGGRSAS